MPSFIDNLPIKPMSFQAIEQEALFFLCDYQPNTLNHIQPTNMIQILEHDMYDYCGVKLELVDDLPIEIEAQTVFQTKRIQITELCYEKLCADSPRDRFTTAHETGHCILHLPEISNIQLLAARGSSYKIRPFEEPERQANYFAAALLMPLPTLCEAYRQLSVAGYMQDDIFAFLARNFKVSLQAVKIRVNTLSKNKGVYELISKLGIKQPFVYCRTQKAV